MPFNPARIFKLLLPLGERLLQFLDRHIDRYLHPRRLRGKLLLQPYVGWGTPHEVELQGRVLLPRYMRPPSERDPRWRNVRNVIRRLFSREVSGVEVMAQLGDSLAYATSNSEGFFTLRFHPSKPLPEGWHTAELFLANRTERTTTQIQVVGKHCQFGVISDLDDTVIQSDVTSFSRMAFTVLTGNARTRSPFPGVGAFYRALTHSENKHAPRNPIFYVSSSPWNFFDLLWQFLDYRRIPLGPLFLRNWGIDLFAGHGSYKRGIIQKIFEQFPHLNFVLVGDSGEQDPHIYAEIVRDFPERVIAVYIRDVTEAYQDEKVYQLAKQVREKGVDLVLAADSLAAAGHAMALGLITPRQYRSVLHSVRLHQTSGS